jgi:hypothetical protein
MTSDAICWIPIDHSWPRTRITFEVDAQGRVTALVLHQFGVDRRAAKIE